MFGLNKRLGILDLRETKDEKDCNTFSFRYVLLKYSIPLQ